MSEIATCLDCGELVTSYVYDRQDPRIEPGARLAPESMAVKRDLTVHPCGHHSGFRVQAPLPAR